MGLCASSAALEAPPYELNNDTDAGMMADMCVAPPTTEVAVYTVIDFLTWFATQRKNLFSYPRGDLEIKDGSGNVAYIITTTDNQSDSVLEFDAKDAPEFAFLKHQGMHIGLLIVKSPSGEKLALMKRQGKFRGVFPTRELTQPWDVYSYKPVKKGQAKMEFSGEVVYELGHCLELKAARDFQYTSVGVKWSAQNIGKVDSYELDKGPLTLNVSSGELQIATMYTDQEKHIKEIRMVKNVDPVQMLCFVLLSELKVRLFFQDAFAFH